MLGDPRYFPPLTSSSSAVSSPPHHTREPMRASYSEANTGVDPRPQTLTESQNGTLAVLNERLATVRNRLANHLDRLVGPDAPPSTKNTVDKIAKDRLPVFEEANNLINQAHDLANLLEIELKRLERI